ncbi:MAG: hypothetical protein RLZZ267_1431 [Bacillota bacterium]
MTSNHLHRDNLLWESSRMMLPEHKEQLLQYQAHTRRVQKPDLDEQHLAYLSEQLQIAVQEQSEIRMQCHENHQQTSYNGTIQRLNRANRTCLLRIDEDTYQTIAIDSIIAIELR